MERFYAVFKITENEQILVSDLYQTKEEAEAELCVYKRDNVKVLPVERHKIHKC